MFHPASIHFTSDNSFFANLCGWLHPFFTLSSSPRSLLLKIGILKGNTHFTSKSVDASRRIKLVYLFPLFFVCLLWTTKEVRSITKNIIGLSWTTKEIWHIAKNATTESMLDALSNSTSSQKMTYHENHVQFKNRRWRLESNVKFSFLFVSNVPLYIYTVHA